MIAVTRIVSIGFLTFFIMGLSELFTKGQFVVPFPFITEFASVMGIAVALVSFRQRPLLFALLITYSVFGILSDRFLWETVLQFDDQVALFESGWIDVLRLVHYLSLIAVLTFGFTIQQTWYRWMTGALILALCIIIFSSDPVPVFCWYIVAGGMSAGVLIRRTEEFIYQRISIYFLGLGVLNLQALVTVLLAR